MECNDYSDTKDDFASETEEETSSIINDLQRDDEENCLQQQSEKEGEQEPTIQEMIEEISDTVISQAVDSIEKISHGSGNPSRKSNNPEKTLQKVILTCSFLLKSFIIFFRKK